jgi:hypothetical protein
MSAPDTAGERVEVDLIVMVIPPERVSDWENKNRKGAKIAKKTF